MASTRKPKRAERARTDLLPRVRAELADAIPPKSRILVALSGGVDSVVLLDLICRAAPHRGWRISALHVNHQLQPAASDWARFCRRLCRMRRVPLRVANVEVAAGNSLERAAREARYAVLSRVRADFVALAHNADDQAETVLLHLLRGAGVRGLAGMRMVAPLPFAAPSSVPRLVRPLLDVPRSAIDAYAHERGLEWVEDPSNRDSRFLRNFLRGEILPRVEVRVPRYREAVARAACHAAEASLLLDELAAADGMSAAGSQVLSIERLQALAPHRAKNVLRYFLQLNAVEVPAAARLEEALRQALHAGPAARLRIALGGGKALRSYRGRLLVATDAGADAGALQCRPWQGEREVRLPEWGGVLHMKSARGEGISAAKLAAGPVTIRQRRGGERLRLDERRPRRSVKNLLHEKAIPPWQRARLPFLYCGETLVWVGGLGTDQAFRARAGEVSIRADWLPDEAV